MERITAAEAREVPLSKNPISRIRQLRQYAGEILGVGDGERLPFLYTRGHLVQFAELGEIIASSKELEAATNATLEQLANVVTEFNTLYKIPVKENNNGKDFQA